MTDESKFQELLDQRYQWPCSYRFKFIVPTDQVNTMKQLFSDEQLDFKPSKKGNYQSVNFVKKMDSSQAVLDIYNLVKNIPGVISL